METIIETPLLFSLPVELLGKISYYCFKEFRSACKHTLACAFPWSVLKKTQANCLILGASLQTDWELGKIKKALVFACETDNVNLFIKAFKIKPYCLMAFGNQTKTYTECICWGWDAEEDTGSCSIGAGVKMLKKANSMWNHFLDGFTFYDSIETGCTSEEYCGLLYIYKSETGALSFIHSCTKYNALSVIKHNYLL